MQFEITSSFAENVLQQLLSALLLARSLEEEVSKYVRRGLNTNQQEPGQIANLQWRTFCSFSKCIHPTSYMRGRVVRYIVSILGAIMSGKVFGSYLCHKMAR